MMLLSCQSRYNSFHASTIDDLTFTEMPAFIDYALAETGHFRTGIILGAYHVAWYSTALLRRAKGPIRIHIRSVLHH